MHCSTPVLICSHPDLNGIIVIPIRFIFNAHWNLKDSTSPSSTLSSMVATSSVRILKETHISFPSRFLHKVKLEPGFHPVYSSNVGTEHSTPPLQINYLHFKQLHIVKLLRMYNFITFCIRLKYYTCNLSLATLKRSHCITKYTFLN